MFQFIKRFLSKVFYKRKSDSVREAITELIQEKSEASSLNTEERTLLSNVLSLRDSTIDDVKIPRAEIISISSDISFSDLIKVIAETPFTRLPVYHITLDDMLGYIHVKDVALCAQENEFNIRKIIQKVLFVPSSMRLLTLVLQMRATQIPMAYVVDEYGGIDGLVTSWDIIRNILGDLQDDHTPHVSSQMNKLGDGSYVMDARISLEDLEQTIGKFLTKEERQEDIETVGGLVMSIAGRVPDRKEIIVHPSGFNFEIKEASPRSITLLRVYSNKA